LLSKKINQKTIKKIFVCEKKRMKMEGKKKEEQRAQKDPLVFL